LGKDNPPVIFDALAEKALCANKKAAPFWNGAAFQVPEKQVFITVC
jgi:hypothetical protein